MSTTTTRYAPVNDGLAIASLVFGLLWLGGLGSVLAVIFGHSSRGQALRTGRQPGGLATAGCVLGWTGIAVAAVAIVISMSTAWNAPSPGVQSYIDCVNSQVATGLPTDCPSP